MKNKFLALALILASCIPNVALAQEDWEIDQFNVDIEIQANGIVNVTEHIVADFSRVSRRGILRDIPYKYTTDSGDTVETYVDVKSVTDETGQEWKVKETKESYYINLRVGDANTFYSEPLTYYINYEANGVVSFFEDYDELYWNSTGDGWPVPIESSVTTVTLPPGADQDSIQMTCFTGGYGSLEQDCTTEQIDDRSFQFTLNEPLNNYEGMTIGLAFNKGLVSELPPPPVNPWEVLEQSLFAIPIILFLFLLLRWIKIGRDPRGRGTIMPYYKVPTDLNPTEIATLIDEKMHTKDLTVAIIDLAVRGYIEIHEAEKKGLIFNSKDITLRKKKEPDNELDDFEKTLMNKIFGSKSEKKLSDMANTFYTHIPTLQSKVYEKLVTEGYFSKNPKLVRGTYYGIGGGLLGTTLFTAGFLPIFSWILFVVIILCGLVFMIFAPLMPQKTLKGVHTEEKILGFKEYVKTAEKNRIDVLQELRLQDDTNGVRTFEKLLPYAVALGVGDKWAEMFKDIYKQASTTPTWYRGYTGNFNSVRLNDRLGSMTAFASSSMTSRPSSSASGGSSFSGGGGFSGGGFGGGGGGSW